MNEVTTAKPFDLSPQTFEQALTFAGYLAESDLVPKDFKSKPGNCLIAMQWGAEVGLKPMQAMQNIAVINGRPSLWGDAIIAIVRSYAACEHVIETDDGHTATCRVKRKGEQEQIRTFSMDDARVAGLAGKAGPWTNYPKRMRQMRARGFALRDVFPDALKGFPMAEELMDTPAAPTQMAERLPEQTAVLPPYTDADFSKNLPAWAKAMQAGRKTAADVIDTLSTRYTLTVEQEDKIRASGKIVPPTESAAFPGLNATLKTCGIEALDELLDDARGQVTESEYAALCNTVNTRKGAV